MADKGTFAAKEDRVHTEPVRAESLMSDREHAAVPGMEAARGDGPFDRGLGVAQLIQLLAGDDSVLSRRQAGQFVMSSQFSSHTETKDERGSSSPPSTETSSQKRPHSAGKCELDRAVAGRGPGEGRGNICSLG